MWRKITLLLSLLAVASSYTENEITDSSNQLCSFDENRWEITCDGYVADTLSMKDILQYQEISSLLKSNIKRVQIRNGKVRTLPKGAFRELPLVTQIVISNMSLEEIETDAFKGVHKLKFLDLSYNNLRKLPTGLLTETGLSALNLEGNQNFAIPTNAPLFTAPKLKWLSLSRCGIEHFPGVAFSETPSLSHLDLSRNRLEQLPEVVFNNTPISELYLNSNNFQTLSLSIFQKIPHYPKEPRIVTMAENNWNCDCRLAPLIVWLIENPETRNVESNPLLSRLKIATLCKMPEESKSKSWNTFQSWSCNL